jgi:thermitase
MKKVRRALLAAAAVCAAAAMLPASAPAAYAPDRVLVKFDDGVSALQQALALRNAGATALGAAIPKLGIRVVPVSPAVDPAVVAQRLDALSTVQFAEVDEILTATAVPNDPRFAELYGLNNTGQGGGTPDADIDAPEGWDTAGLAAFPASGGPKVGIVDTGIRASHEDLAGKLANCAQSRGTLIFAGSIQEGSCADDNGHGTHVAGTVTANANNARGVTGVAFNSPVAACRALGGPLGSGNTSDVANCIRWLKDRGSRIISMSLGGGASSTLQSAVQYAWQNGNGALLVAAAGNDGDSTQNYPAAYPEVVSVAATDNRDQRASFSNANADVEIAAPGVNILSTYSSSNTSYSSLSGTSMATPHVAGVAAIIAGRNPSLTASGIRSKLVASVDDLGTAGRDQVFGFGRVNLVKAAT